MRNRRLSKRISWSSGLEFDDAKRTNFAQSVAIKFVEDRIQNSGNAIPELMPSRHTTLKQLQSNVLMPSRHTTLKQLQSNVLMPSRHTTLKQLQSNVLMPSRHTTLKQLQSNVLMPSRHTTLKQLQSKVDSKRLANNSWLNALKFTKKNIK